MAKYNITAVVEVAFTLSLNPIRGSMEDCHLITTVQNRETVQFLYDQEVVKPYRELENPDDPTSKSYLKHFKKGGPLEWYNPLHQMEFIFPNVYGHGVAMAVSSLEKVVLQSPI